MGLRILDPLAGLLVSFLIIKVGVDFYFKAVKELVDHSADSEINEKIKELASNVQGVSKVNNLKTRVFGNKIYAELQISIDGELTVSEGHEIAEMVHATVEKNIIDIKHCIVQFEPWK
jgi:cation diffusion facilitator family transporter